MATPSSLTGDPVTDALSHVAAQLVGAVADNDPDRVAECLEAAVHTVAGRADPGAALAVVCAAMVPSHTRASETLGWWGWRAECDRLRGHGVNESAARVLAGRGEASNQERHAGRGTRAHTPMFTHREQTAPLPQSARSALEDAPHG